MCNETAVLYQHSVGPKHHLLLCNDDVLYVSKEVCLDFLLVLRVDEGFPGIVWHDLFMTAGRFYFC